MYTIHQVSQKIGLSIYTIRYYTNQGLVPNLQHGPHGERLFDDEAINWLKAIQFFRDNGASLKDVQKYFNLCLAPTDTLDQRIDFIKKMKQQAATRLVRVKQQNQVLDSRLRHLTAIKNHMVPDDSNPLSWDVEKFC